jgi:predicted alpha/beta superfamily hydrolase
MVYLPPGYDPRGAARYPVLYLHDGQNVFDRATSIGEEWGIDETAQQLITAGEIRPIIIVAVHHAGANRVDEYAPTAVPELGGGRADNYGRMLAQELKPYIDRRYKTLQDAHDTAVGGSSLGGLLTMHVGLRNAATFGNLAVLSPSVWWDDRVILRNVEALDRKLPLRIWLDAGSAEGTKVLSDTRALRDALVTKGWSLATDLRYFEAEGGEHNERSWGARVEPFLRFLFPKQP